ncbi:hypothetical protein CCMA1212_002884 [Trichoderma ghanense]|uniref:Secreted protein n=1 Tax=Trichoderma ghanense TaxID=65468 RepID=A0ABY2H922_9HYPO
MQRFRLLGCATLPAAFRRLHGPPFFLFFLHVASHVLAAAGTPPSGLPTTTKHLSAYVTFPPSSSRFFSHGSPSLSFSPLFFLLPISRTPPVSFNHPIHRQKWPNPSHSSTASSHGSGHGYGHTCISYFVHENNLLRVSSYCD